MDTDTRNYTDFGKKYPGQTSCVKNTGEVCPGAVSRPFPILVWAWCEINVFLKILKKYLLFGFKKNFCYDVNII